MRSKRNQSPITSLGTCPFASRTMQTPEHRFASIERCKTNVARVTKTQVHFLVISITLNSSCHHFLLSFLILSRVRD
jgi:hypothetical protein